MPDSKIPTPDGWYIDQTTGELVDPDDAPDLSTPEWREKFSEAVRHIGGKPVGGRPKTETPKADREDGEP